jgi:hypothetical protein
LRSLLLEGAAPFAAFSERLIEFVEDNVRIDCSMERITPPHRPLIGSASRTESFVRQSITRIA